MSNNRFNMLLAAGGTGGHIMPALAIADALRSMPQTGDISFAGTRNHLEWELVPKSGYPIYNIWISGLIRRVTAKNLTFPVKLVVSLFQSITIIRKVRPAVVIACGGYVAGPVGWVAAKMGIPVVLQEQNSYPGLTNRLLAKGARVIFTAFPQADRYFPKGKTHLLGNPTRADILRGEREEFLKKYELKDMRTLLVLGGSGGARAINEAVLENMEQLTQDNEIQVLWQCGKRYFGDLKKRFNNNLFPTVRLLPFIDDMPGAYAASDVVISRSGAISCAELAMTGKPSLLVPSPNVAGDHQTYNAKAMVEQGAAKMIKDVQLKDELGAEVAALLNDDQLRKTMHDAALKMAKPRAAQDIAGEIIQLLQPGKKMDTKYND